MSEKNSSYENYKKIRKDWGDIKPITKTIENKKKYKRKEKYSKKFIEDSFNEAYCFEKIVL